MALWWPYLSGLAMMALAFGTVVFYGYRRPTTWLGRWSGIPSRQKAEDVEPAKTLWDWLSLLGVPMAVALFGIGYSIWARETDQQISNERTMDDALKAYFDAIGTLLTIPESPPSDSTIRTTTLVRSHTLTILNQIDGHRKATVVDFLHKSGLITTTVGAHNPIISMAEANLQQADLAEVMLNQVYFARVHLEDANLQWAFLIDANLQMAHLDRANLLGVKLFSSNLYGADLPDTDLTDAYLNGADLTGAKLQRADLSSADLSKTRLEGVDFSGATMYGADLSGASLVGADLTGVIGLTQKQLDSTQTYVDAEGLPEHLSPDSRPLPWSYPD